MAVKIYEGSVKDLYMETVPTETEFGRGYMEFRNDGSFSVFDYGTMPWGIERKGDWLYRTSLKFFEILHNAEIETHFMEDMDGRKIRIRLASMPQVYSAIVPGETVVYRVPMECVYTKILTPVASLHGRLRRGEEDPEKYGLERPPARGETIIFPEIPSILGSCAE